jgi:hypothetical protein
LNTEIYQKMNNIYRGVENGDTHQDAADQTEVTVEEKPPRAMCAQSFPYSFNLVGKGEDVIIEKEGDAGEVQVVVHEAGMSRSDCEQSMNVGDVTYMAASGCMRGTHAARVAAGCTAGDRQADVTQDVR